MYCDDVAFRGWKLHCKVRGGYDGTQCVDGWAAKKDVVGRVGVDDKVTNGNGFGLSSLSKRRVKVDVPFGGDSLT